MSFITNISTHGLPDEELVANYKETGDLVILSDLYQRYMELLFGVCLKYLKNEEEAKDAVLNIYEELITKLQKYEVLSFRSWIYQVARNHCLMKLRSDKKFMKAQIDVSLMQNEETVHLNGILEKEEHFMHLNYCMEQLVPAQQQVVILFYLEGKCYNEISDSTGIDWKQVRSYIQNGRRNLKICMDKQLSISDL